MKSILSAILLLLGHIAIAQSEITAITILRDPTSLYESSWDNAIKETADTSKIAILYELQYRKAHNDARTISVCMALDIGSRWKKYYSIRLQLRDDIAIKVKNRTIKGSSSPNGDIKNQYTAEERLIDSLAGEEVLNSEIWIDMQQNKLTERSHDYKAYNRSQEYSEPCPRLEWQILQKTDSVAGYPCLTATASFRGRQWKVWFAPDIPVNYGPWKFDGLPGLLLKVEDTQGDYVWTCRSLTQVARPIVYYKVERMEISREKWQTYQRRLHENPLLVLGDNGQHIFYVRGKRMTADDDWTIPYNPIERND